ncbi:hypothetical protein BDU57DRAFT_551821 [Ampelomyces quisqualis]|uniref:Uncharacterized protein n=1 Tax=Ampelomyces quisqualis TaxID=50730 RepID=A0A6A5Q8T6_AMPQU|nr:hypothetical protein BDU57DRAFT_551821 [Ampelomyces quisqualis]
MRLLSELRSWGIKVKSSREASPNKPSRLTAHKNTKLQRVDSFQSETPKPIRVLRIGRCYICFGWSPSRVETVTTYDATIDYSHVQYRCSSQSAELSGVARSELPDIASHHQLQVQELPTESLPQELSDRSSTASAVLEKDAIYELDSPLPVETNMQRDAMASDHISQFHTASFPIDKWDAPQMHKMVHQTLPRLTTMSSHLMPRSFEEHYVASSRLTSANSSITPSPVSPVTPELEYAHGTAIRQSPYVSPISATLSSHQQIPPFPEHAAFDAYNDRYFHNEVPQAAPQEIFMSVPVEDSVHDEAVHGSWLLDTHHISYSLPEMSLVGYEVAAPSNVDQRPCKRRSLALDTEFAWDYSTDSGETSVWYLSGDRGKESLSTLDLSGTIHDTSVFQYLDTVEKNEKHPDTYDHEEPNTAGELDFCATMNLQEEDASQHVSDSEYTRPRAVKRYPKESCKLCGLLFTGRYGKGNLARHIREKHGLVNSMIGKVCRVCKTVYNRADAKRKHEWKKHRLQDVKPNKRRKKQ